MDRRVHVTTLGCKVNQFETAAFISGFCERGIEPVDQPELADIIVVNTCAVTAKASGESRRSIRRLARNNDHALFVLTGCHAQLAANELRQLEELPQDRVLIVGNNRKAELVDRTVDRLFLSTDPLLADMADQRVIDPLPVSRYSGRTRALLRIQDGCDNFCSYCIVPHTRGRSRSLPVSQVLDQAAVYEKNGHHEIVVTGIHAGMYGQDRQDGFDITSLLSLLSDRFPALRFRLSSIEPLEIKDDLLFLMSERKNIMPHLHIPLQSGDNEILRRMNRRYSREQFIERLAQCRRLVPDAALGIDVLVGFPGEGAQHFNNTLAVLDDVACSYVHVFPFSPRPGTSAATFSGHVSTAEKLRRAEIVRSFGTQRSHAFAQQNLGCCRTAVIEAHRDRQGRLRGYTDNYIGIVLEGDDSLINTVVTVELLTEAADSVLARIKDQL